MIRWLKKKTKTYLHKHIQQHVQELYNKANSLESWFYYWIHFQNTSYAKDYSPKNVYYEFGTGWGGTLTEFLRAANAYSQDHDFDLHQVKIFLFDSFEGLPPVSRKEDDHLLWKRGEFAYSKQYITDIITRHGFPLDSVHFVEGYFEKTLNAQTLETLRAFPPSIVTMDVDYYSSTILALRFIGPLLKSGVVFYFDDLYSFYLHPELGQVKAISEFNDLGVGYLNQLTHRNYEGRCYLFVRREWEHFRDLGKS
jgi:hypothetical protein